MNRENRTKLRTLFIINAVVSVPFGIGSAIAPQLFLSLFGTELGPAGAYMMQYAGQNGEIPLQYQ